MKKVIVTAFGSAHNLQLVDTPVPTPRSHEVVVELTSIGMNQADLMARRGEYRLSSGEPPFTPGIEGGGIITAIGREVRNREIGQKVILSIAAPQNKLPEQSLEKGTYRTHFVVAATDTIPIPERVPDLLMGALWLPFATAWGALAWRQKVKPGQRVFLPAASSSVAIAASQIVKKLGGITIGATTSPTKVKALQALPAAQYDTLIVTPNQQAGEGGSGNADVPWWRTLKQVTNGEGLDVIFDPVAAGDFLNHEIRLLAKGGTLWVYGLLGTPGRVDVSPLIRKDAAIRGWLLNSLVGSDAEQAAYQHILQNVATGTYQMPIAKTFPLEAVREAHQEMEQGAHIGKYILLP